MTEIVQISFDRRLWSGPKPSSFIVYALDVGHLALAPEPIPEYERTALFKEKAKATLNGHFAVESQPEFTSSTTWMNPTVQLWLQTRSPRLSR